MKAPIDRLNPTVVFPVERAMQIILRRYNLQSIEFFGCTRRQLYVLLVLDDHTTTQNQIAKKAGIHENTIVKMLDKMQEAGLVSRERNTEDRRSSRVEMETAGRECLGRYLAKQHTIVNEAFKPLDGVQIAHLVQLCKEVVGSESEDFLTDASD
jgi:MarR family transcriptional regulator, lower aerobic nicotinate degradation pathway regulator